MQLSSCVFIFYRRKLSERLKVDMLFGRHVTKKPKQIMLIFVTMFNDHRRDHYDIYLHKSSNNNLALNATLYLLSLGTEIKVSSHFPLCYSHWYWIENVSKWLQTLNGFVVIISWLKQKHSSVQSKYISMFKTLTWKIRWGLILGCWSTFDLFRPNWAALFSNWRDDTPGELAGGAPLLRLIGHLNQP